MQNKEVDGHHCLNTCAVPVAFRTLYVYSFVHFYKNFYLKIIETKLSVEHYLIEIGHQSYTWFDEHKLG